MLLPLVELMCVAARSRVSNLMPDVTGRRPIKSLPCWHNGHSFTQNWSSIAAYSSPKFLTQTSQRACPQERTLAGARCRGFFQQWAAILNNAGWYAREQGSYDKAEAMNQRALDGCDKVFGKEHPDTLTSVHS